jgi:small subunit ribosomal protein S1
VDEFIAEHKEGESVSGRIADVKGNRVTVELGEGVHSVYNLAPVEQKTETRAENVDLSQLSSMLASKWKGGPGSGGGDSSSKRDVPKPGQVRSFIITKLDPEKKRIEVQPA